MADHRVTRFQPARRPPRNWRTGTEPALVMLVVTESSSDDEEDVSGVVSSSSWSCHSQVLVGGIATPSSSKARGTLLEACLMLEQAFHETLLAASESAGAGLPRDTAGCQ